MIGLAGVEMGFAENLKVLREKRGLTQSQVAGRAGVPLRSYQNWEGGTREPRLDALARLATALDTSADELIAGLGDVPPEPPAMKKRKK